MKKTILFYSLFVLSIFIATPSAFATHNGIPRPGDVLIPSLVITFAKKVSYTTSAEGVLPVVTVDAVDINGILLYKSRRGHIIPPTVKLGETTLTVLHTGVIANSANQQQIVARLPSGMLDGSHLLLINNGDEQVSYYVTIGAVGPTGPAGTNGTNGNIGQTGPKGARGPAGIRGVSPAGQTGATGPAGADSTVPGPQGQQGIQGETGAAGSDSTVQGPRGLTGADGASGARGVTGANGTNGSDGSQGIQGIPGFNGQTGPTGAIGANGPRGLPGASVGKVLQVRMATSHAKSMTTSRSWVGSSHSINITPSSSSSKILISISGGSIGSSYNKVYTIYRDNSVNLGNGNSGMQYSRHTDDSSPLSMGYLDSPRKTTSTNYKIYFRSLDGHNIGINPGSRSMYPTVTIIAMEIGG